MMNAPHRQGAEHVAAMADLLKQTRRLIASQIHGSSMGKTLPHGTHIRIQCTDYRSVRPGHIVAFMHGTRLIAHRVIARGRRGRGREWLVTRGDGMLLPDPPIAVTAVLGTVIAVWDEAGWQPPGPPPSRPLRWRVVAALVLASTRVVLAGNVPAAQRLVLTLRSLYAIGCQCLRRSGSPPPRETSSAASTRGQRHNTQPTARVRTDATDS